MPKLELRLLRRLRVPRRSAQRLLADLQVVPLASPFIRLGPKGDGGYVIPNQLDGISRCFSAGVDNSWGFELDLFNRFGITSIMCDGDKRRPVGLAESFGFDQVWLSANTTPTSICLDDWIHKHEEPELGSDLLLQMDIEGSEYSVLRSASRKSLKRFRVMIIEFHGLDHIEMMPDYIFKFRPALKKLLRDFAVVHLHANNCCGSFELSGAQIPRVLEATFLRMDWVRKLEVAKDASERKAEELDFDCVPTNPSIELGSDWPVFNDRRQS